MPKRSSKKMHEWYLNQRKKGTAGSQTGYNLRWYYANKERACKMHRDWSRRNKKHVTAYAKRRLNGNPVLKIESLLRRRLAAIIQKIGIGKPAKTRELIGCDINQFKIWVESKFIDGMTWSNHGLRGWHIDHIRPCASFNLSDPIELRKCFHYTNLQPLWAEDNWTKNAKYDGQAVEEME